MASLSRERRGLSQVVTTLILLVVAVLLAGVVVYYSTNITMTRTAQEDVRVSKPHIWVNASGAAAAFKLQNLGGRDILVDKVAIRGVETPWTQVKCYLVQATDDVSGEFVLYNETTATPPRFNVTIGTVDETKGWDIPTTDIPLKSGYTMLFFIADPTNISLDDVGTTISFTVFTSNAQWIVETNVESASR